MRRARSLLIAAAIAMVGLAVAAQRPQTGQPDRPVNLPAKDQPGSWESLFDGSSLGRWKPSSFENNGKIEVTEGILKIGMGKPMAGITWDGEPPARTNYEIELEAMRTDGNDFFCGLTFPVGKDPCTLICGGWGGALVGLSSIDGYDASDNSTTTMASFEENRWYKIRVRVTKESITAWINDKEIVNQELAGHEIGIRMEVEPAVPLGVSTWKTASALRNIRWRKLGDEG